MSFLILTLYITTVGLKSVQTFSFLKKNQLAQQQQALKTFWKTTSNQDKNIFKEVVWFPFNYPVILKCIFFSYWRQNEDRETHKLAAALSSCSNDLAEHVKGSWVYESMCMGYRC